MGFQKFLGIQFQENAINRNWRPLVMQHLNGRTIRSGILLCFLGTVGLSQLVTSALRRCDLRMKQIGPFQQTSFPRRLKLLGCYPSRSNNQC